MDALPPGLRARPDDASTDPRTAASERDGLAARLDELERYRSRGVAERLAGAREVEDTARAAGALDLAMRARLVGADMLHRVGRVDEAAALAVEVNGWAAANGPRRLLARSHLVLSSVFEGIGDHAAALDHAVRAIDVIEETAPPRERGLHLLRLADALALTGSTDQARRRYREADALYRGVGDTYEVTTILNNLAILEQEIGDVGAALVAVRELLAFGDDALDAASADSIARVLLAAGDLDGAARFLDLGERLLVDVGDVQAATPAELALTRAEVLLAAGRLADASVEVDRCAAICEERDLGALRAQALGVRAEVLAAEGCFEEAYQAHRAFHAATLAVRSRAEEAAARTRQALFETAEARRAAHRFREQARTDPLTDLANRRFIDEELPRALAEAMRRGDAVVAAIVDVDHFKRVNDTFTHTVGDEVLRRLARWLMALVDDAAAATGAEPGGAGFAARLGGEEFLVVLQGVASAAAAERLEALRRTAAAWDWRDVADGLRITVSVGLTSARPDDTQASLLARADAHLYGAKRAGRDRLVGDPA